MRVDDKPVTTHEASTFGLPAQFEGTDTARRPKADTKPKTVPKPQKAN